MHGGLIGVRDGVKRGIPHPPFNQSIFKSLSKRKPLLYRSYQLIVCPVSGANGLCSFVYVSEVAEMRSTLIVSHCLAGIKGGVQIHGHNQQQKLQIRVYSSIRAITLFYTKGPLDCNALQFHSIPLHCFIHG
jgi:hypothetical protein